MRPIVNLLFTVTVVANLAAETVAESELQLVSAPVLAVSPDAQWLAAGMNELALRSNQLQIVRAHVRLIDAESGREIRTLNLPVEEFDVPRSLAFSPDGTLLAWGGHGRVHLFSVESGRRTAILRGHKSHYDAIAFSPHGPYLAGGGASRQIDLWNVKLGDSPATAVVESTPFGRDLEAVSAIAFWPGSRKSFNESELGSEPVDEPMIAAVSGRELRFWNVRTGEELKAFRQTFDGLVRDVAWSPDGTRLVVCGDGLISLRSGCSLRDLPLGAEVRRIEVPERSGSSYFQVEFARDGRTFAASNESSVYVWETAPGQLLATIPATGPSGFLPARPAGPVRPSFAFSPDSRRMFVTLVSGIGVFDPHTGQSLNWTSEPDPASQPGGVQTAEPGRLSQPAGAQSPEPQPRRDQYLLRQIEGLLQESDALQSQGRLEEAKQHREKAAYRARQLAEFLRETPVSDVESENLIRNGSFEQAAAGDPPRNIQTLQPGSNVIAGWTTFDPRPGRDDDDQLEQDRAFLPRIVDWIGPERWKASHGDCCLDIDGGIAQSVATAPGSTYALTFDMAGNPETDYPIQQRLRVEIAGNAYEFQFDSAGGTRADLRWQGRTVILGAADSRTIIRFVNVKPNVHSAGVALDNVSLRKLDPAIAAEARELFSRSMRFEREAEGLKAAGRQLESQQHAEAAARYRLQLEELIRRTKS